MSWSGRGPVLCVGEALVALVPADGTSLQAATALTVSAAGAELNVAVHLARLGVPVRFAGRVGDDPLGRRLQDTLAAEAVGVDALSLVGGLPTGIYVKDPGPPGTGVHYYRADTAASTLDRLEPGVLDDVEHVHVTGITPMLSEACRELVHDLLRARRHYSVSFDVNFRPALCAGVEAAELLGSMARRADIVLVGLDEASNLWGTRDPQDVRDLLDGPEQVVVKNGPDAAVCLTADGEQARATPDPVQFVELVGAGDAFAAGYLSGWLRGAPTVTALRIGHLVARGVSGRSDKPGGDTDPKLLGSLPTSDRG
ncbi:sugar kinase [soil metagenome]